MQRKLHGVRKKDNRGKVGKKDVEEDIKVMGKRKWNDVWRLILRDAKAQQLC